MASSVAIRDQLLGYNVGVQDARLRELATLKPLNPWRTAFVSPRSYAIEHETMELISEHLTTDRPKIEFEVPTYGDLFNAVYVQYDLPPVTQPAVGIRYYQNGVGIAMIEKAELWCKGRLLDEVDQKYIYMNHEVHGTQVDEAVNLTDRVTIPEMALSSSGGLSVTVQIPFFFTRDRHSFLPLHSVREACERLKVRIYLKPMADLVVNLHCSPLGLSHDRHRIHCYGRTILLPAEQRGDYMQKRDYLITTVSAFDTHGTPFKDQLIRTDLPIGGSVKNLLFAVADNSRQTVSDISTDLVPFSGNDVRGLVGKFAARSDAVSDYNCFDPAQERFLASIDPGSLGSQLTFNHGSDIHDVFVSGDHLFTGGGAFNSPGAAKMWNATTGTLVRTFPPHVFGITSIHVQGEHLFTGSFDYTAKMFDIATGTEIRNFVGHAAYLTSVFASGNHLFTASTDFSVKMWEIATGNLVHTFTHIHPVSSVFVDGNSLFTGSSDHKVRKWDINSPYSLQKTFTGTASVLSVFVAVLEGQKFLFAGSSDNTVKQWNTAITGDAFSIDAHDFANGSQAGSVHVVGNHLFTASGQDAKMFDITTRSLVRTFSGHSGSVLSVFATETHLYTGSLDETAKKFSLTARQLRASSNVLEHRRDGRIGSLMIPGDPFEFRAVDKDTGKEVEPLKSFQLKVDGKSRFHAEAPSYHFRDPAFNRVGRRGVYSYSFAKYPSDPHPSGHLNFSRVQDVKVVARASSANDSTLFLFAEKHNILTTDSRVFSVRYSL